MTSYLFKPGHPLADSKGFVEKSDYYLYNNLTVESKRMMVGNEEVYMNFISDSMDPTMHMCNGKMYTSKSKFRQVTKEHGCIEVGNENATLLKPRKPILPDKKERIEQVRQVVKDLQDKQTPKERKKKGIKKEWVTNPDFKVPT